MRFGSGSYDVRQSEGLHPSTLGRHRSITCTVFFLDGSERQFQIDRHARGQELLDRVFSHLELVEREYFGLQFLCILDTRDTQQRKWLEPQKSVRKQMLCPPYSLFFRVKFYVSDPSKLIEEYTRYHYFLQIRKDLLEGKLSCAEGSLALLGSYAVQSELGDYNSEEMPVGYLDSFQISPHHSEELTRKMAELHQVHKGQSPAEAEYNFLDHAKRLEMYGVELYEARDGKGLPISVGVNSYGLLVFHERKKIQEFPWSTIMKISFKRKQFFVSVRMTDVNGMEDETCLSFNIYSAPGCKQLWKTCIEHHTFFRLITPPSPPQKGLFNLGSRFRYSGRTEFQTIEEMRQRARVERTFQRASSKSGGTSSRATISGAPSSASSSQYTPTHTVDSPDLSARIFSHSWARRLLPLGGSSSGSSPLPQAPATDLVRRRNPSPSTMSVRKVTPSPLLGPRSHNPLILSTHRPMDDSRSSTTLELDAPLSRSLSIHSFEDSESSAPSLRAALPRETTFGVEIDDSDIEHSWTPATMGTQACTSTVQIHQRPHLTSTTRKPLPHSNGYGGDYGNSHGYTHSNHSTGTPRNGYASTTSTNSTVNRYAQPQSNGIRGNSRPPPTVSNTITGTSPRSSLASSGYGGSSPPRTRRSPHSHKSNSPVDEDSIVTVRIRPDSQGRFGFNVKGGADQPVAVIVSKVVPGSSADKCYPRLNEGDQLLMINGRDVGTMAHDQVVAYIRAARNMPNGGELVLVIRPNVYRLGEEVPEPDASCLPPEPMRVADTVPRSDKLSHSLRILAESLKNGTIVAQFEQLYRRKPNLSMNECRLSSNVNKNRYRDVCPYDSTRVQLQSATSGDYINASFVNMEIPVSAIVNRYIACQGPLAHTTADFWIMCWEQLCTSIIMLTTTVERGRVKCHQYWPRLYETQDHGRLSVTCLKDRETPNCSYREFTVKDKQSKEERRISQMQYTAWPDHGVPDDPRHFIQFVDEVRRARSGSVEPIVVHCSAGIGRTGVLILMETAACLVEANEPVYPLEIVRVMRDQRAMLIQTPGQYTFVCESILRAYSDGSIKPLAEYQSNGYSKNG